MIRARVPQAVAKAITGHKTDSMFSRYNITSADDKREALRKVASAKAGAPSNVFPNTDRTRTNGN